MRKTIRQDDIPDIIKQILESSFWLDTVETNKLYGRLQDDHDGTNQGFLEVGFSPDGDAWVRVTTATCPNNELIRFRMPDQGGGMSPRTRTALLILAEAIRRDNEEVSIEQPLQ